MSTKAAIARPWPADKIEKWPTDRLVPAARNARLHTAEDVKAIAASIKRFGFTSAVLVDEDGQIIAGHARVLAAQKLKVLTVPVMVAAGWTPDEKAAYLILDNQLSARGTWDDQLLREEIARLAAAGFDIPLLGFDATALSALMTSASKDFYGDPDAVVSPPENPVSRLGDIWALGRHKVVCGDSGAGVTARAWVVRGFVRHDLCISSESRGAKRG
jgi:ParB-like chromosome segregation protein Spo0J